MTELPKNLELAKSFAKDLPKHQASYIQELEHKSEQLQAENAQLLAECQQLKAHNRQLVEELKSLVNFLFTQESPEGFDDPHKGFVECDAGWQDGVEWGWNQIRCKLQSILEVAPPAKLALAEAEVLRAAEEYMAVDLSDSRLFFRSATRLQKAVEAMQEAKGDA